MKFNISLKWFVSLVFLIMGIVLVVGYTKLSGRYFILGMDNMIASKMEQLAKEYQQQTGQVAALGFIASADWQQQPLEIQETFTQAPNVSGELIKSVERDGRGGRPKNVIFAMRYDHQQSTVYVSHTLPREAVTEMVDQNIKKSRKMLLVISCLSVLALAVVLALILWLVSRPIAALGDWTRTLEADQLKKPAPDFYYPELNKMADLIKSSLSSVRDGLEREQQFLRYTSHELRTPISVVRNNVELLRRLQASDNQQNELKQQEVINRIDRASLTMQHLTETLLWLSKESPVSLPETDVQLDDMLKALIDEMQYLLNDKNVKMNIGTQAFNMKLPEMAAKIVLGNLIRNAFQHTWEGVVQIYQQESKIEIINTVSSDESKDNSLGFGLGLQLTERLANRLGWTYENSRYQKEHRVVITF